MDDEFIWVRDAYGRVGKLLLPERTRVVYASGEQAAQLPYAEMLDGEYDFAKQRDEMWRACCELDLLNRHVLSRLLRGRSKPGDLRYEELLQDVGVTCMRRAVLLYSESRGSMRGYVARCLKRAYLKALHLEKRGLSARVFLDEDGSWLCLDAYKHDKGKMNDVRDPRPCKLSGLEDADQLSTIVERAGLSPDEVSLLMSRYDSSATLRDLAEEMQVSSPQTVLNALNRILERCRRAV